MAARAKNQLAMDERVVRDAELEDALEARLRAYDDLSEVRGVFSRKDEEARAKIDALKLSDGEVVRVGRFRVERRYIEAREVAFSSKPSSRIAIRLNED